MSKIPFVRINFPDPAHSRQAIYDRFIQNARERAARRKGIDPASLPSETEADEMGEPDPVRVELSYDQIQSISKRAHDAAKRYEQRSPLNSMKEEDRKRILGLRNGLPIIPIPSEHRADEIGAALQEAFPWIAGGE